MNQDLLKKKKKRKYSIISSPSLSNVHFRVSRMRNNQQGNNGQRIWDFVDMNGQADELSSLHGGWSVIIVRVSWHTLDLDYTGKSISTIVEYYIERNNWKIYF